MALPFEMQVGDLVMIKSNLSVDDPYPCGVADEMAAMKGAVCTVKSVKHGSDDYQIVELVEDEYVFSWSTPMFEGLAGGFYYLRKDFHIFELRDGKVMMKYKNSIMTQNGYAIGVDKYDGNKHVSDSKFDVVKVYAPSETNYRFDKGALLWTEEEGDVQ